MENDASEGIAAAASHAALKYSGRDRKNLEFRVFFSRFRDALRDTAASAPPEAPNC